MFGFPGIDGMTTLAGVEFEIIKLELKAGDTLVIKTDQPINVAQARELRESAEKCVPDAVKVMIFTHGLSPEVIKAG
jgi:hypothetical protein